MFHPVLLNNILPHPWHVALPQPTIHYRWSHSQTKFSPSHIWNRNCWVTKFQNQICTKIDGKIQKYTKNCNKNADKYSCHQCRVWSRLFNEYQSFVFVEQVIESIPVQSKLVSNFWRFYDVELRCTYVIQQVDLLTHNTLCKSFWLYCIFYVWKNNKANYWITWYGIHSMKQRSFF